MPAHRLTPPPPLTYPANVTAVLSVLSGTPVETAAERAGTTTDDLTEAVQTYHAAGTAALCTASNWYQARVQFPRWDTAEHAAADALAPRLRQLQDSGLVTGWWFIRKHPCWRLRLQPSHPHADATTAIRATLDVLAASRVITRWAPGIYEPETAAFGGQPAMDIAHRLFCADSDHVLRHIAQTDRSADRREMSLLLCGTLFRAASLDTFEHGDVWHRIAAFRPLPQPLPADRIDSMAGTIRNLTVRPARLLQSETLAGSWALAFDNAGRNLHHQATQGHLTRGIRNVLAHIVIFHWNRLGLTATTQAVLAHAAAQALLPQG
jgi:thiopeptide-type bacteriocin biosynthesis protein